MPEFINSVPTLDEYDSDLQLGPADNVRSITFSVLQQPALAQFWKYDQSGKPILETVERVYAANTYGAIASKVGGVQFRSAIAGLPATILAELTFQTDPDVVGGTIGALGGLVLPNGQLANAGDPILVGVCQGNSAGVNAISGKGFTVSRLAAGQYQVALANPYRFPPSVFAVARTAPQNYADILSASTGNFIIEMRDRGTQALNDAGFLFHVQPAQTVQASVPTLGFSGYVTGAGDVLHGIGFTVVRNGTGDYTINFTTPMAAPPVVIVMVQGAPNIFARANNAFPTTTSYRFQTRTITARANADSAFYFKVIPMLAGIDPLLGITGRIDTTAPTILQGTGFTVVKNGVGLVTVTYNQRFPLAPVVVATSEAGGDNYPVVNTVSVNSFQLLMQSVGAGAATDGQVNFHVVPQYVN